ncbi:MULTISPECIES: D-isomer specific 2-hydroxyacid dehydrogenase family protein [unclassified Pseudomonas]|uniref:D-isomer specific 2-hydroxyacid dehydrogenase family protein n=1 Tax=unclassified Pseudomonas TaxID=196821 RepID=UPI0021C74196|nr:MULTISPECIES: D-isomer specific 2-hydroxyacid dehydrogenase family protein [unclassified Pseudomonas]MCU1734458.1 D-isomer specific 2-hydroxyacid dehydrogenase family protein [Pseudomonas sp. 20P_3.2_Bac4]MCU1745565.1 D-isomer specific 2-hydroxyacid dehydrogenase family protein [Pseudomonas sp. 20P_3.2_Bac5]
MSTISVIASQLDAQANDYIRQQLPEHRVLDLSPDQFNAERADVLIVRPINVRGRRVDQPPAGWPWSLRWVQLVSSGIDFYPDWLFQGPPVTSGKGSNAEQVAEFALAAIFSAAKQLPNIWVKDDDWSFTPLQPVRGKTLGILGLGSIGRALAAKGHALGLRVIALGRPGQALEAGVPVEAVADLHQLFAESDHLVIAAPLTAQTRGLINRDVLASAKPGLHLINIARGGLLDQQALLEGLEAGWIGRATLDVTEPEPLPAGHPLYSDPRVFISPHTCAISTEGIRGFAEDFVENFRRYHQGEALRNLVDHQRGY